MTQYERSYKKWTQEEIEYLYDSWGKVSFNTMSKNLKRSKSAIKNKVDKLKLGSFLEGNEYITLCRLRCGLGYNIGSVIFRSDSWIKKNNFPVKTKIRDNARFKVVYLKDFWKWAEENKTSLNFCNFEKYALGPEPKWVDKKRKEDKKYNKNKKWTPQEDEKLVFLMNQQKYTYKEIAEILGRKEGAIKGRLNRLNIKLRPVPANSKKFTEDEIETILNNIKLGYDYEYIQKILDNNRTITSIKNLVYRTLNTQDINKARKMLNEKVS